jgi:hypothetical protein
MERSVMNKLLASIFGILLATGLAIAEPPDGKGKDKEQKPEPIQVYAQGVSIGRYMGGVFGNSPFGKAVLDPAVWLLSDTGYIFSIDVNFLYDDSGSSFRYLVEVPSLFFSDPDCQGTVWISAGDLNWTASTGVVFNSPAGWPTRVYYTGRGELGIDRVSKSEYQATGCINGANNTPATFIAFPNDEAITGVSNTAPAGPFVLGPPQ